MRRDPKVPDHTGDDRPWTSTIAYSILNVLATKHTEPVEVDRVFAALIVYWRADLDRAQFDDAVRELVARGLASVEDEKIDTLIPSRRAVVSRDPKGKTGWEGWKVERQAGATRRALAQRELLTLGIPIEAAKRGV